MIVSEAVQSYLDELRLAPDDVLAEMEAHGARDGIPIVPPVTGAVLHLLARASGAQQIVEVGTAIGVSTLYLARGLPDSGKIVSFEIDPERHAAAKDYLGRAGVSDRTDLRLEDARAGLASLDHGAFDLAFIDGVKLQYGDYYEAIVPLLSDRGVIAVDNMLMSGTVAENRGNGQWTDEQIAFARGLNEQVVADERFDATLLTVGDGLLVAVRR